MAWLSQKALIALIFIYIIAFTITARYYASITKDWLLVDVPTTRKYVPDTVTFIKSHAGMQTKRVGQHALIQVKGNVFTDDFIKASSGNETESIWCFRNGTLSVDNFQCDCLPNWHGIDCGQPEVIWRALIKTQLKYQRNFRQANAVAPVRRIYYILELGHYDHDALSMLTLSTFSVIDWYLVLVKHPLEDAKNVLRRFRAFLPQRNAVGYMCADKMCNIAKALVYMRKELLSYGGKIAVPRATDMLLYGDQYAIFQSEAFVYFKYYTSNVPLARFRLKYNVYGFFWQHPQLTKYCGALISFANISNAHNPHAVVRRILNSSDVLTVGDLNHYAGWYCEFCSTPSVVIQALEFDSFPATAISFPNTTRDRIINEVYLKRLIVEGTWLIDGKTKLLTLRSPNSKYYAPSFIEKKPYYHHLLINSLHSADYYGTEYDNDDELLQQID